MRLTANKPSRQSMLQTVRPLAAQGFTIPAPTGGWDAKSPVASMKPDMAITLDNWFPQTSWVELRKGFVEWADTSTGAAVESLMAYQGLTTNHLFAASDDSIFDVTFDMNGVLSYTGLSNARLQHINFATTGGNFLLTANGADGVLYYDGFVWATAVITVSDSTEWVYLSAFKGRVFALLNNSTKFAYLPVDSIQGTAAEFELGGLMTKGGYLMACATWSIDAGDGPDDYAVFVTSRGQVIIYRGTDPSDADLWALVGVFDMGAPIGRRCLTKAGADIAIISIDGVLPLSKAMIFERAAVVKISLTENIQRVMNESARTYGSFFGWQIISYPKGNRVFLNVPIVENTEQQQYVMNTLNGAWCRYTGHNGSCWELFNDNIYFGGNEGIVYKADTSGSDAGEGINADMIGAFNYYGSRGFQKRWTACQPLLTTDNQVTPGLAFNVDFQTNAPISVSSTTVGNQSLWDVALWDVGTWASGATVQTDWLSVSGIGSCASIRMQVSTTGQSDAGAALWGSGLWGDNTWQVSSVAEITLQINNFNVTYETGRAFI